MCTSQICDSNFRTAPQLDKGTAGIRLPFGATVLHNPGTSSVNSHGLCPLDHIDLIPMATRDLKPGLVSHSCNWIEQPSGSDSWENMAGHVELIAVFGPLTPAFSGSCMNQEHMW